MKKINLKLVVTLLMLFFFVGFHYYQLSQFYEEMVNSTGLIQENFEKKVKYENEKATENQMEFNELLRSTDLYSQPEGGLMEEGQVNVKKEETKEEQLRLHARSALLLDADNNRVLYEINGEKRMPMASTTKIMTCIVALENAELNGIVTISSYAAGMPDVQLGLKKGEQYYLKDLLYSLMLESHNDSAVAIAEYIGGSVEGFATLMNDKARSIGCENTNFITPNGLDAEGHYTTARDLAVIASYAIKNEQFIAITNTSSYQFSEIKKGRKFMVSNKNRFLYMMDGAIGVKTGFTNGAGYCFVGAVKKTDRTLISVVLGCGWPPSKSLKWSDTKELMEYGITNFERKQIFQDVDLEPVFVKDGQKKYISLDIQGNLTLLLNQNEKVHIVYEIPDFIEAPVKTESVIGKAIYYIDDKYYTEIPIYTTENIAKINFQFCFDQVLRMWSVQY